MSINTTIYLSKLAFLDHMKRHTTETYLSPPYKQCKSFSTSLILPSSLIHCDTVIVVIVFHKSHNIRNCPFCWNSSSYCWHNFFSINLISWSELWSRSTKVCGKNTKCMATMFLYQYTMCYMKCTTGELRACSIVLKTQYSNLVPSVFLVVARELRKTLVKYDEISKILGDFSHCAVMTTLCCW
jgi:hypothetical protein